MGITSQAVERGQLSLQLRWPGDGSRHVQVIPLASQKANVNVLAASGEAVATRTLRRDDAGPVALSFDLEPGEGYTVAVELVDASGNVVAGGKSAPFSIQRQRISAVELTLEAHMSRSLGKGASGYEGDGAHAEEALLRSPIGLTTDRDGNLYIAEWSNHVIRKVDSQGIISTLLGTGKMTTGGVTPGDAVEAGEATFSRPTALAFAENGDLFIADSFNQALRLLPASSGERYGMTLSAGLLHTVYVQTATGDQVPHSVAVDAGGNVFFAETNQIMMLDPKGAVTAVAGTGAEGSESTGNGPASEIPLSLPDGLLIDPEGNLLFTERNAPRVRMLCRKSGMYFGISMASGSVYTIAGKGVSPEGDPSLAEVSDALQAELSPARGLALDSRGNLYIAENLKPRILRLTPQRRLSVIAGSGVANGLRAEDVGDGGAALKASFRDPAGLAILGDFLYVADSNNHRVRRIPL